MRAPSPDCSSLPPPSPRGSDPSERFESLRRSTMIGAAASSGIATATGTVPICGGGISATREPISLNRREGKTLATAQSPAQPSNPPLFGWPICSQTENVFQHQSIGMEIGTFDGTPHFPRANAVHQSFSDFPANSMHSHNSMASSAPTSSSRNGSNASSYAQIGCSGAYELVTFLAFYFSKFSLCCFNRWRKVKMPPKAASPLLAACTLLRPHLPPPFPSRHPTVTVSTIPPTIPSSVPRAQLSIPPLPSPQPLPLCPIKRFHQITRAFPRRLRRASLPAIPVS